MFKNFFRHLPIVILLSITVINSVECDVYRLPQNVRPIRYTLTMEPHLEPDLAPVPYEGRVVIQLKVTENTRNITLHKRKLKIEESSIEVVGSTGTGIKILGASEDRDDETYTINLESDLLEGKRYNLTIGKFTNNLGYHNVGFYLAKYTDKNNVERRLAVTDFEPTDARLAFPCFDEPGIKAKFIINIIRKAEHNSVSNEELESTRDLGNGKFQDTFKETPDMSAYLVAFVVSDYKHTEKIERHKIFGRPEDVESSGGFKYSLDVSVKALQALEEYTGINYSMSKMDQFAVPDLYFKDEAMENWGLVIYGESHLLCTNESAAEDLKRCTSYIAHEFAHQWFGNLVTPAWWDYTWLSESFASYFQYYITDIIQPTWRFMDLFTTDYLHVSFSAEENRYSGPLNYVTKQSGQFPPLHVLYAKGSSIIRMMQHFLTDKVFKRGLHIFLKNRKFRTAEPSDLYSALDKSVDDANVNNLLGGRTVSEIMRTWDSIGGFPIVNVTRNYITGSITFEQHYRHSGNLYSEESWIPLNYVFQSSVPVDFSKTTADIWLIGKNVTVNQNYPTNGWIIVNKQQTGYYRVNYDRENWERIIAFMNSENFKSIHVLNRAQLINDAFYFAKMGYISYDVPLRLSNYLIQETDYIPYAAYYGAIKDMHFYILNERLLVALFQNYKTKSAVALNDNDDIFKNYVVTTLTGALNYLGFDGKASDTLLDRFNRQELVRWLCRFEHPECLKYSLDKVKEVKENNVNLVAYDVEGIIFCTGITNAAEEEFDALHRLYNTSKNIYQRRRLRDALNCSRKFAYTKLVIG